MHVLVQQRTALAQCSGLTNEQVQIQVQLNDT
jgi:hypothetical protein